MVFFFQAFLFTRDLSTLRLIGHFRVVFCVSQSESLSEPFISGKYVLQFQANQTHLHKKGFARRLLLKQRHMVTWKWSICRCRCLGLLNGIVGAEVGLGDFKV